MPKVPTDLSNIPEGYQSVAEDIVKGRIQDQFSQNLGFDDYADRTEAQAALGEARPDAATWQEYGATSGIVGTGNEDIFQTNVKAGDNVAATRSLTPNYQDADFGFDQTDQFNPEDFGLAQTDQPTGYDLAQQDTFDTTAATTPDFGVSQTQAQTTGDDQFGFETIGDPDYLFGSPTVSDLGVATGSTTGQAAEDTGLADLGLGTTTEGTQGDYGVAQTDTMLTNPEFDQQVADFDAQKYLSTQPSQDVGDIGVQTAAYSPTTTLTDVGEPTDVGLRSLLTQQKGGTSAMADDTTETPTTLAGQNLATNEAQQDQTQQADTKVADSTLTTGAPAGTITEKILGEGADQDVPTDSLTSKYFAEDKKEDEDADSLSATSLTRGFNYTSPRPTNEILNAPNADTDQLESFLSPLRTNTTSLTTGQNTPLTNAATQGTAMDEDNFDWDSWDRAVEDYVQQYDASRASQSDSDPDANGAVGSNLVPLENMTSTSDKVSGVDVSFLDRLSPEERERYLATLDPDYVSPLAGLAPQDLGISQQNIDEFNQNFNPAGGFSSGYQTVGTNRVMIHDDGTASVFDPTTGGSSYLTKEQVDALVANGTLNSAASGYVAATGGTGNRPGGSGPAGGGGTTKTTGTGTNTKSTGDKIIDKLVNYATSDRGLATIAGAVLGPSLAPKGINPMGLRSLQAGSGQQMVQTGAKGTGGKGGVKYFEKKAGGGAIDGYAKGGGLGYLKSAHDGMADQINATIDNKRPAKLSGGEFVIPADVVSHLGNGNSEAGAKQLYELMSRIRKERTGTPKQAKQVNPKKYLPR